MKHLTGKSFHGQMSESFLTAAFLSVSGGLQDAYTYIFRGGVFANGQTGNVVLLSVRLCSGDFAAALRYLVPVAAFALGVAAAELIRQRYKRAARLHWRQLVLLCEMAILLLVGFLPNSLDMAANALVSFSCAMQVQAFRKVSGFTYASTMCLGNLRSGMEALCDYERTQHAPELRRAALYLGVILLFAVGAGLGSLLVSRFGSRAIWASCLLLAVSLLLMFICEEEAEQREE